MNHLERLVTALADQPAASVPDALGDWGQTKAAYRFWDNDRVAPVDIRDAHRQALVARLGGFLNRRGDGEPGVKCLWRGGQALQAMVKGYRLGFQGPSP